MSARTRGKSHPHYTEWCADNDITGHAKRMRALALARPECKVCGGIPRERAVPVAHPKFGKVWMWYMCGPCQERLENGDLLGRMGVC